MHLPDLAYLRRIKERSDLAALLSEPAFLQAQELFFSVVRDMKGGVDFDLADMREVHALAALGDVEGLRVLDIGCGSTEPYVLTDTFRDRYPPFLAEMLAKRGARVTGTDIRPNPSASYDHRVLDLTDPEWKTSLGQSYDLVACLSIFNAPSSPFEQDAALCDRILEDARLLLAEEGILIVTLRDELFDPSKTADEQEAYATGFLSEQGFGLIHLDGNCAWVTALVRG